MNNNTTGSESRLRTISMFARNMENTNVRDNINANEQIDDINTYQNQWDDGTDSSLIWDDIDEDVIPNTLRLLSCMSNYGLNYPTIALLSSLRSIKDVCLLILPFTTTSIIDGCMGGAILNAADRDNANYNLASITKASICGGVSLSIILSIPYAILNCRHALQRYHNNSRIELGFFDNLHHKEMLIYNNCMGFLLLSVVLGLPALITSLGYFQANSIDIFNNKNSINEMDSGEYVKASLTGHAVLLGSLLLLIPIVCLHLRMRNEREMENALAHLNEVVDQSRPIVNAQNEDPQQSDNEESWDLISYDSSPTYR